MCILFQLWKFSQFHGYKRNSRILKKKTFFVDFQNWNCNEFCWRLIFEILIIHKPSLGSFVVPHTILARSVLTWYIYIYITYKDHQIWLFVKELLFYEPMLSLNKFYVFINFGLTVVGNYYVFQRKLETLWNGCAIKMINQPIIYFLLFNN